MSKKTKLETLKTSKVLFLEGEISIITDYCVYEKKFVNPLIVMHLEI